MCIGQSQYYIKILYPILLNRHWFIFLLPVFPLCVKQGLGVPVKRDWYETGTSSTLLVLERTLSLLEKV